MYSTFPKTPSWGPSPLDSLGSFPEHFFGESSAPQIWSRCILLLGSTKQTKEPRITLLFTHGDGGGGRLTEMQTVASRVWTKIINSVFLGDNRYVMYQQVYMFFSLSTFFQNLSRVKREINNDLWNSIDLHSDDKFIPS